MGDKGVSTGYLYANSSEGTFTSSAWQTKDWTSDASGWITATLENIVVGADGQLTVGATVSSDNTTGAPWGDFDEFTLVLVEAADSHEHTYGEPVWTWNEDGTVSASFSCKDDDDTQIIPATVTSETTDATCTKDGQTVYTATVTFGETTYTDTKTVSIPTTGHTWGVWEVTMVPTASKAGEETRACSVCGETETREIAALGGDTDNDGTGPSDSTGTGSATGPETGDSSNLVLYITLMAVSLCAAASIVVLNRKKHVR